jgi:hypothetical protein
MEYRKHHARYVPNLSCNNVKINTIASNLVKALCCDEVGDVLGADMDELCAYV